MLVATMELTFHIPWADSLKDKRMVSKSLCAKIRDKFHVSVAEIDHQDLHRTLALGIACVGTSAAQLDSVMDHILVWLERASDAELTEVRREMR